MAWKKVPPELIETFHDVIPDDPRSELKKMFGCPCCFAGGNLFTGVHQETLFVRLPPGEREELLAEPGASQFEPLAGRKMREYVVVPRRLYTDRDALRQWVARGFAYALSLPVKESKQKSRRRPDESTATTAPTKKESSRHHKMTADVKTKAAKRTTGRKVQPAHKVTRKKK